MLTATSTSWLSGNFLIEEDGKVVAELAGSAWREQATAHVGTASYAFYRKALFKGGYSMERAGQVIADAEKPRMLQCLFDVAWAHETVELRKLSRWKPTFGLFKGEQEVGTIRPIGFFKRRGRIDGAPSIPLEIRVFLFWIALMAWKRNEQVA